MEREREPKDNRQSLPLLETMIKKDEKDSRRHRFRRNARVLANLGAWFLTALGSFTLAWVGQLTWYDMSAWRKDLALIFFGSRTGENISLGIGMKVIYYFLIGLALFLSGLVVLIRERSTRHCFGYVASLLENTHILEECLTCPKLLECMRQD